MNVLWMLILCAFLCFHQVFAQGKYTTLGPSGCGIGQNNCHASENRNMVDKHKNSVDDIIDSEDARKYAELSGIGAVNNLKGTSKCMECHGTIISGKGAKEVEDGVGCESCHGPGSGYKDPHSEGPKGAPGTIRPGYPNSLKLGLNDLKDENVLAKACVRCHLLTDQKILASGHPDGAKFNYKSGMKSVAKHWKYRDPANIPEQSVFKTVVARKGPTGGSLTKAPPLDAKSVSDGGKTPAPKPKPPMVVNEEERSPVVPVRKPPPPPKPAPVDITAPPPAAAAPIELPPFPAITDSTRIDEMLLLLKKRLELLYKKTGN